MQYDYLIWVGVVVFLVGLVVWSQDYLQRHRRRFGQVVESGLQYRRNMPILPRNQRDLSQVISVGKKAEMTETDMEINIDLSLESEQITIENPRNESNGESDMSPSGEPRHISQEGGIAHKIKVIPKIVVAEPKPNILDRFNGEASMLDDYFRNQHQEPNQDNEALLNHVETLVVVITPRDGEGVSGARIIDLARQYGMKYGVLNMFHRYENPEGWGMLWFSMLGVGIDGVKSFDLLELPQMNYKGLALFLSLPHPKALHGFDSMVQVAQTIATELDADIHDELDYLIDADRLHEMRTYVSEYKV